MRKRLPPLDSLRVLVACVRHGNFSRAAVELGITATAVSQRMRTLEAQIGVKLFSRHGPRLTTTARAKSLGQRVEHALELVRVAVDDCRRLRQPLRVTCAPTFAARWLLPRLPTYHVLPGAESIALDTSQGISLPGTFDVAIRNGAGPWPGYAAVKLLAGARTAMLSPKLLPPRSRITARMLLKLPLIPDPGWSEWFKIAGVPNANPRFFATRFPNYELEAQAAVNGVGAVLLSPVLYGELVAQKALLAPFDCTVDLGDAYWLLCSKECGDSHFVRWIKAQFSAGQPRE